MRRKEGAFIAAQAAIFVGVIALVALPLVSASVSAPAFGRSASTVASNGLLLSASISATQITVGQALQVNISLFNTLAKVNTVPTSNDSLFQGIPVFFWAPCFLAYPGTATSAARAVVLKGDYAIANISSVANIAFPFQCTMSDDVEHVIFQPTSSQANITGTGSNNMSGPYHLMANFTTTGYWELSSQPGATLPGTPPTTPAFIGDNYPPDPPVATAFVPGVYTVAATDEWGQAVFLHFLVKD